MTKGLYVIITQKKKKGKERVGKFTSTDFFVPVHSVPVTGKNVKSFSFLPFSILCAKSVIIHTSITYQSIKIGMGVNCNRCSLPISDFRQNKRMNENKDTFL